MRELGAGLNVWPNATRVLREFGLLDEVVASSQVIERLLLRTSGGELISEVCAPGKSETPTVCIHRRELLSILAAKIPPECIRLGEKFERFEQDDTCVMAGFEGGQTAEGEALIGADGIYSRVRAQSLGESKPVYRGYQAWRGVADFALPANLCSVATEYWGRGKRLGVESLGRGRAFCAAMSRCAIRAALSSPGSRGG